MLLPLPIQRRVAYSRPEMKKPSKLCVHRSTSHINGVRPTAAIKKGEEICEYRGQLMSHDDADDKYGGEDTGHTFLFILNDVWVVDGTLRGNIAKWINHSCEPNCEAVVEEDEGGNRRKDRIVISALRDIKKGEELTYDYEIEVPHAITRAEKKLWTCRCGFETCTGSMIRPAAQAA